MKRLLFFIAFMTVGTAALIQLLEVAPSGPAPEVRQSAQVANVLNMNGVRVHQLVGEQMRWDLQAGNGTYNENTNTGRLADVRFRVYDAGPGAPAQVAFSGRSAVALLTTRPNTLVLQGAVVLNRGDGMEILSERIEFDAAHQVLTAPGHVQVRTPQGVQEGASLRFDVANDRLEFTSPVFYQ